MQSIIEIKSIHEALNHIDTSVDLVFLDVDNTLITASDRANIVAWAEGFETYIRTTYAKQHNLSISEQNQLIQHYVTDYVVHMQPQLIEPTTLDFIKNLQRYARHIIALTARPHDTAAVNTQHLAQCGIHLADHLLEPKQFQLDTLAHPIIFQHGIISCGRNSKGKSAEHFFNTINFKPQTLAFIDDSRVYLDEMAEYAQQAGIAFKGFRYGQLDEQVKQFVFSGDHVPKNLR